MRAAMAVLDEHDPVRIATPLIKHFEKFYPEPYVCPAGKLTVGYGHVIAPGERFDRLTERQAARMLRRELVTRYFPGVVSALGKRGLALMDLEPHQEAAALSFAYNCGVGAIHGRKQASWPERYYLDDIEGARRSWLAWNKGDGKVLAGLVRRRFAEWQLFTTGEWEEHPGGWRDYYEAVS